ncbi:MAG: Nif3-like dinuclear metal center hexameric protein [Planctomycetota bacterium]
MIQQKTLIKHLDKLFQIHQFIDVGLNGLQVESVAPIKKVCFAVDACLTSIEQAIQHQAQILIVHHGLFWGRETSITGIHYQRIQRLLQNQIALYAIHIPLDVHPELGNNVSLANALNLEVIESFGEFRKTKIVLGTKCAQPLPVKDFQTQVENLLRNKTHLLSFGKEMIQKIALCTGDASFGVHEAYEKGYDLYFTGEREHISYHLCKDLGFHCLFGGHYATETFGLKSLAQKLQEKFSLETCFLEIPTDL